MKKELIPIIAAYWGCECEYIYYADRGIAGPADRVKIDADSLIHITQCRLATFKLHLRRLWDITEEELRELGGMLYGHLYTTEYSEKAKILYQILEEDEGDIMDWHDMEILQITNALFFSECAETEEIVQIINHLRAKGFCLDQCLVDAGLVEWKGVAK